MSKSVKQRLKNIAIERGEDPGALFLFLLNISSGAIAGDL